MASTPQRCPSCGRFLSQAFVVALGSSPGGCPRCGELLGVVDGVVVDGDPDPDRAPDVPVDAASSARPDQGPGVAGRDTAAATGSGPTGAVRDPLAGWDVDEPGAIDTDRRGGAGPVDDVVALLPTRQLDPVEAAVLATVGAVVAAAVVRTRRVRAAVVAAVAGVVVAWLRGIGRD